MTEIREAPSNPGGNSLSRKFLAVAYWSITAPLLLSAFELAVGTVLSIGGASEEAYLSAKPGAYVVMGESPTFAESWKHEFQRDMDATKEFTIASEAAFGSLGLFVAIPSLLGAAGSGLADVRKKAQPS